MLVALAMLRRRINPHESPIYRLHSESLSCIASHLATDDLVKAIRHAARFTYYVGSSSYPSSSLFEVEFKVVDEDTKEPKGDNLLNDGLVEWNVTKGNSSSTFCLVLRNKAKFNIWPFVFIGDPSCFSIRVCF